MERCGARERQHSLRLGSDRYTSSLIAVVSLWKFTVELESLFCLHLCHRGLVLTPLSCSDDKRARRMWSMGSQLANLISLHAAGSRSHHITQPPYAPHRCPPAHTHAGSPLHFVALVEMAGGPSGREKAKVEKKSDSPAAQHSTVYSFDKARKQLRAASLWCPSSPQDMKYFLRLIIPFLFRWLISEWERPEWRF